MWKKVGIRVNGTEYIACMKRYDEGSEYGIEGGRISKLQVKEGDKTVINYDRGWDIKPQTEEQQDVLETILVAWN